MHQGPLSYARNWALCPATRATKDAAGDTVDNARADVQGDWSGAKDAATDAWNDATDGEGDGLTH